MSHERSASTRYWYVALLLASGVLHASMTIVRPMLSYRALEIGLGPALLGLVAASFSIAPLAVVLRLGRLVDRSGHIWYALGGALAMVGASAIVAWDRSVIALFACSAVLGLGHLAVIVALQALIASGSAPDRYVRRFADLGLAASFGQLVGPAIGGAIAGNGALGGTSAAIGAGALVALAGVPLVMIMHHGHRVVGRPVERPSAPVPLRTILTSPGMASTMVASLTIGSAVDVLTVYLPAYGEAVGWSPTVVGALLAVRAGGSMVSRIGVDRLADRLGRAKLLAGSMAISAAAFICMPLATALPAAFAVMVVAGLALGIGMPLTLSMVATQAVRGTQATALSVRIMGNRVGQVAVPLAAGLVAGVTGVAGVLALTGIAIGLGTAVVVGRGGSAGGRRWVRTAPEEPLDPLEL